MRSASARSGSTPDLNAERVGAIRITADLDAWRFDVIRVSPGLDAKRVGAIRISLARATAARS